MSHTTIRTLHCDPCGRWTHGSDPLATVGEIRREARARGWRVGLPGGRDVCPWCVKSPPKPQEDSP